MASRRTTARAVNHSSQEYAVTAAYGSIVLLGGFMGYFKANSMISLIASLATGIPLLIVAGLSSQEVQERGKSPLKYSYIPLFISLLLTVVMAIRYVKTKTMVPSGSFAAVSAVTALYYGMGLFKRLRKAGKV